MFNSELRSDGRLVLLWLDRARSQCSIYFLIYFYLSCINILFCVKCTTLFGCISLNIYLCCDLPLFHQPLLLYLRELHPAPETASASSAVSSHIPPCFDYWSWRHRQLLAIPWAQGETCALWPWDSAQLPPTYAHCLSARQARDGRPPRARSRRIRFGESGEF